MKKYVAIGGIILAVLMGLFIVVDVPTVGSQEENTASKGAAGKNLQILTFDNKIELNAFMQNLTKELGVDCKYCHDLVKGFDKDIPELHKDEARAMMKMTNEINEKYFKDSDHQITCFVCHRGRQEPVFSVAQWQEILEKEKTN